MAFGQSFEAVLDAAKLGSRWAWAAIYREIAGPVTGFLRVRGVADPEDATADVFFEISRSIEGFTGQEDSFHAFVFAIAHERMVQDRHSVRPPRSRLADRVLDRVKRDADVGPDTNSDADEAVRHSFEVLNQDQRDVLALRVVAGLSIEQTAKVKNCGTDTVKRLQRRAMAKARVIMPPEVAIR